MKIDLDELERTTMSAPGRTSGNVVTLALIARIRELEALAAQLIRDHVRNVDESEIVALLDKGAVLP